MIQISIKQLVKNSGILVLSNAALKLLNFLLLPLYTNVLTPQDYGITDTVINASTLVCGFFSLSVDWGIETYFYDENDERHYKKVTSSGLFFFAVSAMVMFLLFSMLSKNISCFLLKSADYQYAIVLGILVSAVNLLYFSQRVSTRLRGKMKAVGLFSFIELAVTLLCNIFFILVLRLGYISILLSNLIGQLVSMCLYTISSRDCLSLRAVDMKLLKTMMFYSIPITPILIFEWINSFLDRYFIGHYFTQAEVGLYGIGSRMVGMLSVLTSSFLSAYASFAYSNAKDKSKRWQYSLCFDLIVLGLTCVAAFVTLFSKEIIKIITAPAFHTSYTVVGALLFAHILHTLGGIIRYGILISKMGKLHVVISGCGALTNIVLNYFMVPRFSFIGAAVATLFSEAVMFLLSYYYSSKLFECDYSLWKVAVCVIGVLAGSYFLLDQAVIFKILIYILFIGAMLWLYSDRAAYLFRMLLARIKK